jgi:hypothetical protein
MKLHYPLIAVATLLFVAFGPDSGGIAIPIFSVACALSFWNGLRLLRERRMASGLVLIVLVVILLASSARPWYAEHSTPWEDDPFPHRHSLWELGHVH